jgi:hypothetical protein
MHRTIRPVRPPCKPPSFQLYKTRGQNRRYPWQLLMRFLGKQNLEQSDHFVEPVIFDDELV